MRRLIILAVVLFVSIRSSTDASTLNTSACKKRREENQLPYSQAANLSTPSMTYHTVSDENRNYLKEVEILNKEIDDIEEKIVINEIDLLTTTEQLKQDASILCDKSQEEIELNRKEAELTKKDIEMEIEENKMQIKRKREQILETERKQTLEIEMKKHENKITEIETALKKLKRYKRCIHTIVELKKAEIGTINKKIFERNKELVWLKLNLALMKIEMENKNMQ